MVSQLLFLGLGCFDRNMDNNLNTFVPIDQLLHALLVPLQRLIVVVR